MLTARLALLAAALLVVPVVAFTDATPGSRASTANVVTDANSYLKDVKVNPSLTALNLYQATAVTVTHQYASPAGQTTTLDVTATKAAGNARFSLTPTTGSLARDASLAIAVKDNSITHLPITETVTIRIDAVIKQGTTNVGSITFSRSVTVTV